MSAQFAALAVLLGCSAFFSITETAMMAANRHRLRHLAGQGDRGAKLALDLLGRTDKMLGVILLGNNHKNESRLKVDERDVRSLATDDSAFTGAKYVFYFVGIGDIGPSIERPIDYMSTNVMGTVHALEAARHAGVRKFVYAASSSCYGLAPVP